MRRSLLCIAVLAAGVLASGPAAAAIDIFGKFTGIDGESTTEGHEKWSEVLSYSRGASNPASFASGAASGRVNFADFSFTKLVDKSSPTLRFDLADGKMIDQALFDVVTTGAKTQTFLQYKFSDVLISSYSVSGAAGGGIPMESLSFAFGKVQGTYWPQDPKTGGLRPRKATKARPAKSIAQVEGSGTGAVSRVPMYFCTSQVMLVGGWFAHARRSMRLFLPLLPRAGGGWALHAR